MSARDRLLRWLSSRSGGALSSSADQGADSRAEDIFISYRRRDVRSVAHLLAEALRSRGYRVFLDVRSLGATEFAKELPRRVAACTDFVAVIGPEYLARCSETGDFVRLEVAEALRMRRHVVPVVVGFPEWVGVPLPSDMEGLKAISAISFEEAYTAESVDALCRCLRSRPRGSTRRRLLWIVLLLAVVFGGGLYLRTVLQEELASLHVAQSNVVSPDLLRRRGLAALSAGDHKTAFESLAQAVAATPGDLGCHRDLEEAARRGALGARYLELYRAWVAQSPSNAVLRNYLGNAWLMIGGAEAEAAAEQAYRSSMALDPALMAPVHNLAILLGARGELTEAEVLIRRFLESSPRDAQAWVNLGLLHIEQSSRPRDPAWEKGVVALTRALELDPSSAVAHRNLGRLHDLAGETNAAREHWRISLRLKPDQLDLRALLDEPDPPRP